MFEALIKNLCRNIDLERKVIHHNALFIRLHITCTSALSRLEQVFTELDPELGICRALLMIWLLAVPFLMICLLLCSCW